jgi:hypothetical protein
MTDWERGYWYGNGVTIGRLLEKVAEHERGGNPTWDGIVALLLDALEPLQEQTR